MRRTVVMILVLALVGGGVYLAVFQREWVMSLFQQAKRKVEGYEPAKTPTQAMDMFVKAVKARDYRTAAEYCDAKYAEQLKKAAEEAASLGNQIDHLLAKMDSSGVKSDKAKLVLRALDPFPKDIEYRLVEPKKKAKTEDTAYATLKETSNPVDVRNANLTSWNFDLRAGRAFVRTLSPVTPLELKRDKEGKHYWKVHILVTPDLQQAVQRMKEKAPDLVRALKKLDANLNNEATTKADFEVNFKSEVETALK